MRFLVGLLVIIAAAVCFGGEYLPERPPEAAATPVPGSQIRFRGFDYAAWGPGIYASQDSDTSLKNLAATGANWMGLVVTVFQPTPTATAITLHHADSPTDADLCHAIATAHRLKLKVMLKPQLDLSDDPAHWRGDIGPAFTEAQWAAWFASYTNAITHFAKLAARHHVEMFCVGTELEGTSMREADWRTVIAAVRKTYSGPLIYAGNWSGEAAAIRFWDALDYIGVDAYYPLTERNGASVADLNAGWTAHGGLPQMAALATSWKRQVVATEVGFRSVKGAPKHPWEWKDTPAVDLQEQANGYQSVFEILWPQPWFAGAFFWDWEAKPSIGGMQDAGYTPFGKPAEIVIRHHFKP